MAAWALDDAGIRCVIASSFGDIFSNSCVQHGVLVVTLPVEQFMQEYFQHSSAIAEIRRRFVALQRRPPLWQRIMDALPVGGRFAAMLYADPVAV